MGQEVLFAGISVAVTCLLLKLRETLVGEMRNAATSFRLNINSPEPEDDLLDNWPSEIMVPADFFTRRSL